MHVGTATERGGTTARAPQSFRAHIIFLKIFLNKIIVSQLQKIMCAVLAFCLVEKSITESKFNFLGSLHSIDKIPASDK